MDLKLAFDSQGYVSYPKFASAYTDEIVSELEHIIRDAVPLLPPEHVFYEDKDNPDSLKQLQHLQQHATYFRKLAKSDPFTGLAESLLGEPAICQNVQYFNKPPGTGKPTPPHQDGYYFCLNRPIALTMWIALEPVDEENGCVRYIPRSHLTGMRKHGPTETLGFSQGITDFPTPTDQATEIAFPAAPGDLLAHHAMTIHRANGNRSPTRSRRVLGLIYYGESVREDPVARTRYKEQLKTLQAGKI